MRARHTAGIWLHPLHRRCGRATIAIVGNRPVLAKGEIDMMSKDPGDGGSRSDQRRLGGGAIASLTGLGVLLIFMIQNTEDVTLHFLFWNFTWPLWLFTLVTAVVGAFAWFGLGVIRRHRRRKARREDRRS
jgi:uncharacterized integral membrane protein